MPIENFQPPGEASWSVNDIPYGDIVHHRIDDDTQLFYLLASASFVEITSDLYTHNLVEFFGEDGAMVDWLRYQWEPEELQHGVALKRYVRAAWPGFDWETTYRGFLAEFSQTCAKETLEAKHALELVARCVIETGTSSFYGMLAAAGYEPVLTGLLSKIRDDEVRHYKHFYRYFLEYCEREQPSRLSVLKTLLKRAADVQSAEAVIAFKHIHFARNPGADFHRSDYDAYCRRVKRIAKNHLPRAMAVKMMLKPLGFGAAAGRIALPLGMSLCRLLLAFGGRGQTVGRAPSSAGAAGSSNPIRI